MAEVCHDDAGPTTVERVPDHLEEGADAGP
jgi:hypothetical protein